MFNPTDHVNKLYELVSNYFINLGDEIVSKGHDCDYIYSGKD
jgi:hypothetical protein